MFTSIRNRSTRATCAVAAAVVVSAAVAAGAGPAMAGESRGGHDAAARSTTTATAPITWGDCTSGTPDMQCSTITVPISYTSAAAGTTRLAAARIPAKDQAHRIGVLMINPGGPGGSGVGALPMFADGLGPEVRAKFDIIAVDPRGTGGSERVNCTKPWWVLPVAPAPSPVPTTADQIRQQNAWDTHRRSNCKASGGALLDHVSTADNARDMDLIRKSLGEKQISYYGVSYGTVVGQTYAAMFPSRVRTMALDGTIDVAALTGPAKGLPAQVRTGQDAGMSSSIRSSMAQCDKAGPAVCALAPNALKKYDAVRDLMRTKPIGVRGLQLTEGYLDMAFGFQSYDPANFPQLASLVNAIYRLYTAPLDPATYSAVLNAVVTTLKSFGVLPAAVGSNYSDYGEIVGLGGGQQVACADQTSPAESVFPKVAAEREKRYPGGGPWVWGYSQCSDWPASSAASYRGPWDTRLATPPVILNTTHDPATPLSGAVRTQQTMPGSRLIKVTGWGHGVIGRSSCAQAKVSAYFLHQTLPANSTCAIDEEHRIYGVA